MAGEEPSLAVLIRLRGFSATGRVADLVALQAAEGHLLAAQQRGSPAVWAFGLLALLSGCGRTGSLRRLLDGPLRILPDDLRAFSSAIGDLAAGGAAVAPALEILGRLARGKNRDIAAQARAEIAHPRAPARLDDSQRAVVAQAEQGLEAFIAARIENPAARAPPMTWLLIALNLAAYGLEWWRDAVDDTDALLQVGALWPPAVLLDGQWWRVVSACFLHLGWVHLGMNMLSLLVIGAVAERMFGWWRMLAVYAVAGVGANAAVIGLVWAGWFDPEILVGASGAIMGLVGALVAVAARNWWRARTRATRRRLVWLIGVIALQSVLDVATPEISFAAHGFGVLLGFATGLLVGRQAAEASAPPPAVAAARMSPPRIDRRRVILIAGGAAVALLTAAFFPRRYEDAVAQRLLRPDPDPDPD